MSIVWSKDSRVKYENFRILVRSMVYYAWDGKAPYYRRVCNTIAIPWQLSGMYCGCLGEFCIHMDWPILNSMIVSEATEKPASDFFHWKKGMNMQASLGTAQAECKKFFRKWKTDSELSRNIFSGLDAKIAEFLEMP